MRCSAAAQPLLSLLMQESRTVVRRPPVRQAMVHMDDRRTLLEHEEARRRELFVDRVDELAMLLGAAQDPGPRIFYVHGPGGIGKTSLLQIVAVALRARGVAIRRIDARDLELTPEAFLLAFDPTGGEEEAAGRRAILFDTYELMLPIEAFVLRTLLARARGDILIILASRTPPSAEWRALSLWRDVVAPLALRNLPSNDAQRYLEARGVDPGVGASIAAFSHGHPLALAIAADAWRNSATPPTFDPGRAPDVISVLYDYFVRGIPDEARALLEIAAILPATTESLLAAMRPNVRTDSLRWLSSLSFMLIGPHGVFPHDLAREVILAELRWRNPRRLMELAIRAQRCFAGLCTAAGLDGYGRAFADFAFVLSHNPRMRVLMVPPSSDLVLDELRRDDEAAICAAVARHEGVEEARLARYWLSRQPTAFRVARTPNGAIAGFCAFIRLDLTQDEDRGGDPRVAAAWAHALPLLKDGLDRPSVYVRFFMSCEVHQRPSPATAICSLATGSFVFLPRCALLYIRMHDEWQHWQESVRLCGAELVSELAHEADGKGFLVTLQDHRALTPVAWLARFSDRTALADWAAQAPVNVVDSSISALSRDEFYQHVRDALRNLTDPLALRQSPLIHSQAVEARVSTNASQAERSTALAVLLRAQIEGLRGGSRGDAWYQVLQIAYLGPRIKHESAAHELGLSYITFRRLLGAATEFIVSDLWHLELT